MNMLSEALVIKPKRIKDQIIYVRMQDGDVKQIDSLRKKLKIKTRSEMIRTLVVEAMKRVEIAS